MNGRQLLYPIKVKVVKLNMIIIDYRTVVLNLDLIEPQGFVESVSGVWQRSRILRLFAPKDKIIQNKFFL